MSLTVGNDLDTLQEAITILSERMPPSKIVRLLAALQVGRGDYTRTRERLFEGETVDDLFAAARALGSSV